MTRKEQTGDRSLAFSKWIRENCNDSSTGFLVGNLDWIFWDYKRRRLILIEEKTRNATCSIWFRRLMDEVFVPALREHCKKTGIEFKEFHVLTFENTSPKDGRIWLDDFEIDEQGLAAFLNG